MAKNNFYVIFHGRKPGIYDNWSEAETQVKGFSGAKYKGFSTYELAHSAYTGQDLKKDAPERQEQVLKQRESTKLSISTDGSCRGNPGRMEYRLVWTDTGDEIFRSPVYPKGTNNIAEFLALVEAIRYIRQHRLDCDIFTDSKTAIAWVREKKMKSTFVIEDLNLLKEVNRALAYLLSEPPYERIFKWDTALQGEIKADFGRK